MCNVYMKSYLVLNRAWTLEVLEFEKKVSKLKLQGFKMRKNGLKPAPKEPPIFVKESNPRSKKNHIKRRTCPMPFLILALTVQNKVQKDNCCLPNDTK